MVYNKAWEAGYARDRDRGLHRYVEATDTRATLRRFLEAKVPVRAIARAGGLSDTAIGTIIDGRRTHVQRATAAKVAALTLVDVYELAAGTVPAVGAVRRVQALMALGWRKPDLQSAGIPAAQLVTRSRPRVTATTWHQVREVYDQLSMTPGPSPTARARATRRGYAPPLAWDENSIDDPRARPQLGRAREPIVDSVAVTRVAASPNGQTPHVSLTGEEQLAATRALTARGASARDIAGALGVSDRTVNRWRRHLGTAIQHPPSATSSTLCQNATSSHRLSRSQQLGRTVQPSPGRAPSRPVL